MIVGEDQVRGDERGGGEARWGRLLDQEGEKKKIKINHQHREKKKRNK